MRIAPGADPQHELRLLADHLRAYNPWHVQVDISEFHASSGFICPTGGRAMKRPAESWRRSIAAPSGDRAGGSIPFLHELKRIVPDAEFVLWGCEDNERSRIHGANESVDLGELERMIVTQALLLQELGKQVPGPDPGRETG